MIHKVFAALWVLAGGAAFLFGWHDAVWAVWIASVYANAKTDWSTAAAQDNSELLAEIRKLRKVIGGHERG
jgi:hypothetical protein